ncbi:MAG: hypothetical protein JMDDDDMK_01027 [Acidobacteria bacterium]|nr:hypothetical protein [Acidobacteriota bacterium]
MEPPINAPFGVTSGQFRDAQSFANAPKHVVKFLPLRFGQRAMQKRVRALGIINQHVEHIAERPVRYLRPARLFDRFVD